MQLLKATKPLEDFLPLIMANSIGNDEFGSLPKEAALLFARNAAISFAETSGVLTKTIKVDLQCGLSSYPLDIPDCETVIGVKSARLAEFNSEDCGLSWSWGEVSFTFDDDVLHIYPAPTRDVLDGLEVEVVLAPSRDACELDSRFYSLWYDVIVHGALAEVHAMPGMPWSSVTRADYRRRMFAAESSRHSIRKKLQGRREPLRAPPNPDFMFKTSQRRW